MREKCSINNEKIAASCSYNIVTPLLFAPPFHERHQTCLSVLVSCHIMSSSVAALSSETTFVLLQLCCIIYVQNSRRNPAALTCHIGYQLRPAGMCLRSPSHAMVIYCVQIRLSIEMSLKKGKWKAHGSLIIHIEEPTEGLTTQTETQMIYKEGSISLQLHRFVHWADSLTSCRLKALIWRKLIPLMLQLPKRRAACEGLRSE